MMTLQDEVADNRKIEKIFFISVRFKNSMEIYIKLSLIGYYLVRTYTEEIRESQRYTEVFICVTLCISVKLCVSSYF